MTLLVWRGLEEWLAESCEVGLDGDHLHARGVQLGAEPHPYRADYELTTGADWVTERLTVTVRDAGGERSLDLVRAPDGSWTANGEPLPDVAGALDCDLAFSPLTNFMPARRLTDGAGVRYIALDGDFTADLELDEDGFVVRYPRLAERVPSGGRA